MVSFLDTPYLFCDMSGYLFVEPASCHILQEFPCKAGCCGRDMLLNISEAPLDLLIKGFHGPGLFMLSSPPGLLDQTLPLCFRFFPRPRQYLVLFRVDLKELEIIFTL
jgi:hypothetical protein